MGLPGVDGPAVAFLASALGRVQLTVYRPVVRSSVAQDFGSRLSIGKRGLPMTQTRSQDDPTSCSVVHRMIRFVSTPTTGQRPSVTPLRVSTDGGGLRRGDGFRQRFWRTDPVVPKHRGLTAFAKLEATDA